MPEHNGELTSRQHETSYAGQKKHVKYFTTLNAITADTTSAMLIIVANVSWK